MKKLTKEDYREHLVNTIEHLKKTPDFFNSVADVLKVAEVLNITMKELYMLDNDLI